MSPLIIVCALGAACLYAVGSMNIKKSMQLGASNRRAIAVTNIAMALWALPLLIFLPRDEFAWSSWWFALAAGVALFVGRIFSVKALDVGDLSVVGPLLGMKTLLVALFTYITGQAPMSPTLWLAAICASVAVMLVQRGPRKQAKDRRVAAVYAFLASVVFALTDILVVEARSGLGIGLLSPTLFITVALLIPFLGKLGKEPPEASRSLYSGAAVMGFQTTLVVLLIGLTGQAVLINIIYCSRVIWTVVVDLVNHRRERGIGFFAYRMLGAVLLMVAISAVILDFQLDTPKASELIVKEDGSVARDATDEAIMTADCEVNEESPARDIHWPY